MVIRGYRVQGRRDAGMPPVETVAATGIFGGGDPVAAVVEIDVEVPGAAEIVLAPCADDGGGGGLVDLAILVLSAHPELVVFEDSAGYTRETWPLVAVLPGEGRIACSICSGGGARGRRRPGVIGRCRALHDRFSAVYYGRRVQWTQ